MAKSSRTPRSSSSNRVMRKRFGALLKQMREEAGLTQQQVAAELGYDYYTMISQIERGLARPPADDLMKWSELYKVDPRDLGKLTLYWTDPFVYQSLYGINPYDDQKLPRPSRGK